MKQPKLVAAIVIVAGLLIWPVSWQLYPYVPELKQFTPTEYTNYVIMAILGTYIISALSLHHYGQEATVPQITQSAQNSPPKQNPMSIEQLAMDMQFLKDEVKRINIKIMGLEVFSEKPKEVKKDA